MSPVAEIAIPDVNVDAKAYRQALYALLEGRDPLDVASETSARIHALIDGRSREDLERRPEPDEWSAAEIIGHLIDVDIAMGFRWRMVLSADRPSYPGYDQDLWAQLPKPPVDQLMQTFDGLRAYNVWMLKSLPATAGDRVGLHSEAGEESLRAMIQFYGGHDLAHLNQLERALER